MKYKVSISELNHGFAIIEADSKEEAESRAQEVYNKGAVTWVDSKITEIMAQEEPE